MAIFDGNVASPTNPSGSALIDPFNGQALSGPQTLYLRSGAAARIVAESKYAAYFLQQDLGTNATNSSSHPWDVRGCGQYFGWDSNENVAPSDVWRLTVAFDTLPLRYSSDEEVHYLASYYELGGNLLMGLGFTPSGRIVNSINGLPDLKSQLNAIQADGQFRDVVIAYYWPSCVQEIWIDGVQKVSLTNSSAGALPGPPITNAVVPRFGFQSQFAIFAGPNALTSVGARIAAFESTGKFRFVMPSPLPTRLSPTLTLYPDIQLSAVDMEFTIGLAQNKTFVVRNNGYGTLHVSSISTGYGQVVASPSSVTLLPGTQQTVTVHYSGGPGPHEGATVITSDDPDEPSLTVPYSVA